MGFSPETFRRYMQRAGFSAEDVADQIGLSRQSVSLWLAGRTTPSPPSLVRVAELLRVTPADLTPGISRRPATLPDIRIRAGHTQSAAAEAVGISQTVLSQIERGRREMDQAVADKLARLYEVSDADVVEAWELGIARRRDDLAARAARRTRGH
ncbi:helix-turn-helix transcriptional regulator [Gordonia sp. N1V]|uniref:helix-turn-helix domain-containing protein n=1 Tax=Gordonia sp. N1V TaxID=3034163 RepID=UPI0023E10A93|nr:helix-turn-helix transcriptional regulator [Gordonia sp. N1V]MDF3285042.1 helix-turn-helix transcriptional regulator [Gordonia sp. N1V]